MHNLFGVHLSLIIIGYIHTGHKGYKPAALCLADPQLIGVAGPCIMLFIGNKGVMQSSVIWLQLAYIMNVYQ